jgi:hypothetical protein
MAMTMAAVPALALFMGLVLILALYGLTVSGHFPAKFRSPAFSSPSGTAVIWGTLTVSAVIVAVTLALAWYRLPLSAAIIGGGAMLLFAPLLLQPLPDKFVNGRGGLLTFTGLSVGLAVLGGRIIA